MYQYHILIVDGEKDSCDRIRGTLMTEGYSVDVDYSAKEALKRNIDNYNLILVDIMMGEISGFKMAHIIRSNPKTATIPIVFVSAKNTENDRLTAFSVGADDYITKPFSPREMVARIKVIISRFEAKKINTGQFLSFDRLTINLGNKQVLLEGKEIPFTKKEYEILKLFLESKNRLFTREELLKRIWSEDAFVLNRTIDVNITRIRKKIGQYGKHIVTRLGQGYCFE
ncbi:MAG: response regulator transcription factor [Paludibacter sp.]|nr:response regulator transcription factor [Paludibacter sp.]